MSAEPRRARRFLDLAALCAFSVALAAPTVDRFVRPDEARDSRRENREPAPRPAAPTTAREVAAWPGKFDDWFADTSGLRDLLLGARNTASYDLGISPSPMLDVGARGWIFYRGDWSFEAHRGIHTLDVAAMQAWVDALEERRAMLAARGSRFLFALVPDKESIYPELLPRTWDPVGPKLSDLFLAELARRTQVEVLDLRPALLAAKALDRPEAGDHVYFPRGTHWTSRGAYAASQAIVEHLRPAYPRIPRLDRADLQEFRGEPEGEDSWMHNLYAPWLLEPAIVLGPRESWRVHPGLAPSGRLENGIANWGDPAAPSVYFLHDSYGPFIQPYLAQSCRRLRSAWQSFIDGAIVEVERPDVVLLLKAERMLAWPPDVDRWPSSLGSSANRPADAAVWALDAATTVIPEILGDARFQADGEDTLWATKDWKDRFVVQLPADAIRGRRLAFEYELDAPQDGKLDVWIGAEGPKEWSDQGMSPLPLVAGHNKGGIVLPDLRTTGRLMVRVGPVGTWRFRRLAVRAVGPVEGTQR
ncbi:MAG: hypothetical protein NTY35_15565 [Planctomycetota bacterium]|nr:hypothetical protein [Planctomycetota bacterium]